DESTVRPIVAAPSAQVKPAKPFWFPRKTPFPARRAGARDPGSLAAGARSAEKSAGFCRAGGRIGRRALGQTSRRQVTRRRSSGGRASGRCPACTPPLAPNGVESPSGPPPEFFIPENGVLFDCGDTLTFGGRVSACRRDAPQRTPDFIEEG